MVDGGSVFSPLERSYGQAGRDGWSEPCGAGVGDVSVKSYLHTQLQGCRCACTEANT